jgi:hypothetical protein
MGLGGGFAPRADAGQVDLVPPPEGHYATDSPIEFDVTELPDEVATRLKLEIDDVEVTDFVQRTGNRAFLELPVPLEAGPHTIRVVDSRPDGSIVELGRWQAMVERKSLEKSIEAELGAEVVQRVADHRIEYPPDRTYFSGTAKLQGHLAGDDWEADSYLPVIYQSEAEKNASGQPWDLANYLVKARKGRLSLEAGHFAPEPTSLIMEQLFRRGLSTRVELPELKGSLTGFSVRGEPITGFEEGLGVRDRNQRVSGAIVTTRPLEVQGAILDLSATYLRGRTGLGGTAVYEAGGLRETIQSGTAWSLVADGAFLGQRLRVRGEYARTRFDPDVDGPGNSVRDDGYSVLVGIRPWLGLEVAGQPLDTELTLELSELGPYFGSPANPGRSADRRLEQAAWRATWAGLDASVSFERERHNVDDRDELPKFRTDGFMSSLNYSPQGLDPEGRVTRWLGKPFVGVDWGRTRVKPTSTPDPDELLLDDVFGSYIPVYADQVQRTSSLRLGSWYPSFTWSLTHGVARFEDRTRLGADTRSDLTALSLSFPVNERLNFGLTVQRDRYKLEDGHHPDLVRDPPGAPGRIPRHQPLAHPQLGQQCGRQGHHRFGRPLVECDSGSSQPSGSHLHLGRYLSAPHGRREQTAHHRRIRDIRQGADRFPHQSVGLQRRDQEVGHEDAGQELAGCLVRSRRPAADPVLAAGHRDHHQYVGCAADLYGRRPDRGGSSPDRHLAGERGGSAAPPGLHRGEEPDLLDGRRLRHRHRARADPRNRRFAPAAAREQRHLHGAGGPLR